MIRRGPPVHSGGLVFQKWQRFVRGGFPLTNQHGFWLGYSFLIRCLLIADVPLNYLWCHREKKCWTTVVFVLPDPLLWMGTAFNIHRLPVISLAFADRLIKSVRRGAVTPGSSFTVSKCTLFRHVFSWLLSSRNIEFISTVTTRSSILWVAGFRGHLWQCLRHVPKPIGRNSGEPPLCVLLLLCGLRSRYEH